MIPAEADTLRKVVSKKHKEKKLRDFYARFVQGAGERGVSKEVIEEVWQMMMGFDGYSFCKPHSASYTLVAYKSAYLRAHYPAEFMASVISNGGGYYSTFGYLSEARRMGLRILPPDINRSEIKYTGKEKEIRSRAHAVQGALTGRHGGHSSRAGETTAPLPASSIFSVEPRPMSTSRMCGC